MKNKTNLKRRQLDRRFSGPIDLKALKPPKKGWVHEIRTALGMTLENLAYRMGVIKQRVSRLESDECRDAVTLNSLKSAAEAMDCDFVYAIVPKKSLEESIYQQARKAAKVQLSQVGRSMSLEDQNIGSDFEKEEVDRLARELVERNDRAIWRLE